ncbi:hypothetical protein LX36DRAFT_676157 [Colletotrichum falcatum]|nr:hypothetical protein LX36DRAFT_676157 [Colletotrichum falcatum]
MHARSHGFLSLSLSLSLPLCGVRSVVRRPVLAEEALCSFKTGRRRGGWVKTDTQAAGVTPYAWSFITDFFIANLVRCPLAKGFSSFKYGSQSWTIEEAGVRAPERFSGDGQGELVMLPT